MFELRLENAAGDQLTFGVDSPFSVVKIEGINPPKATINTSQVALIDGELFNSSKVNMRTINLAFAIEWEPAKNRIEVYKVLKSKQYVKMYYDGDYRNVYIEGYVQSIDISYFEMVQIVTVMIICPAPYFKQAQEIINELKNVVNMFHFPFSSTASPQLVFGKIGSSDGVDIENEGDVDCGMIIELYARDTIVNPKVYDYVTGQYIGVVYTMQAADLITIDTRQGQKSVKLLRNAVETNLFNYVMSGSTWLQLPANGSTYVYEVGTGDAGNLVVTFRHNNLYEGV